MFERPSTTASDAGDRSAKRLRRRFREDQASGRRAGNERVGRIADREQAGVDRDEIHPRPWPDRRDAARADC